MVVSSTRKSKCSRDAAPHERGWSRSSPCFHVYIADRWLRRVKWAGQLVAVERWTRVSARFAQWARTFWVVRHVGIILTKSLSWRRAKNVTAVRTASNSCLQFSVSTIYRSRLLRELHLVTSVAARNFCVWCHTYCKVSVNSREENRPWH